MLLQLDTLKTALGRFFIERYYDQAAQTAYYLMLSIFPFLLFVLSLLNFLPINLDSLLLFIEPYAPGNTYGFIEDNVLRIVEGNQGGVLSISLLSAFWLASMAVQSLARSFAAAYEKETAIPFWRTLMHDLGVTAIFMIMIPVSLFVPLVEKGILWFVAQAGELETWSFWIALWPVVKWITGSIFLFLFFLFFYSILPKKRLAIRTIIPGALFTTLSWQFISWFYGQIIGYVSYTEIYGQLAGIIILMIWLYLSATVLLIGGLINATTYQKK
ncbi:YihY/virulence factor BrkB family protein [Chryseomicrobium sp. FSL W7-1435]|uniref:YihY/virulence factor BrkB family protein n=1 Tax=Chryseomicrobium sp. FSL W7-1435 TaxID=2921704 RepID=UPI003159C153